MIEIYENLYYVLFIEKLEFSQGLMITMKF